MSRRESVFCFSIILLIVLLLSSSTMLGQCHRDEVLVGEDEHFWHCALRSDFSEAAADLVNAQDSAARVVNPHKSLDRATQDLNCSAFFRAVGTKFKAVGDEWTSNVMRDGRGKKKPVQANEIIKMIEENKSGNWLKVTGSEERLTQQVQELANNGIVVVGVREGGEHGHLAIASPLPLNVDLIKWCCHGPMVRDGNVHMGDGKKKPSGWGAVRAGFAFENYTSELPAWYVWLPSQHKN